MSLWGPSPSNHHKAGLTGRQNARVTGLWKLPYRFQRKACEARKHEPGSELLKIILQRMKHKGVSLKLKMQWKPQKSRKANNIKYLLWKAAETNDTSPRKACEL